jgi:hypothetical protein
MVWRDLIAASEDLIPVPGLMNSPAGRRRRVRPPQHGRLQARLHARPPIRDVIELAM